MFRRSANPMMTRFFLNAMLANLDSVAGVQGLLNTSEIGLFTNAFDPSPDTVVGDLTEATFAGYAVVASTVWAAPGNVGSVGKMIHFEANFIAGAIVPPGETVTGYFVRETGGAGELYIAERFVTPAAFALPTDFLSLDVALQIAFQNAAQALT